MLQIGDLQHECFGGGCREVVLLPTDGKENDRAVWSADPDDGVELHLYSDVRGNWRLSGQCTPGESSCFAYFEGGSVLPPGERTWKQGNSSDGREGWTEGVLKLLCGDAGEARVVRGLARHTCMNACYFGVLWARRGRLVPRTQQAAVRASACGLLTPRCRTG